MDLKDLSFEEIKNIAENVEGFVYDKRWGERKLRGTLTTYLEDNPDKIPVMPEQPPVVPDNGDPEEGGEPLVIDEPLVDNGLPLENEDEGDNPPPSIPDGALVNERPLVIPDEPQLPPDMPKADEEGFGLVKIQSAYRGEIASSFGMLDFGDDGICEVTHECAEMLCTLEGYDKC